MAVPQNRLFLLAVRARSLTARISLLDSANAGARAVKPPAEGGQNGAGPLERGPARSIPNQPLMMLLQPASITIKPTLLRGRWHEAVCGRFDLHQDIAAPSAFGGAVGSRTLNVRVGQSIIFRRKAGTSESDPASSSWRDMSSRLRSRTRVDDSADSPAPSPSPEPTSSEEPRRS